jgi:hypothetical protein
VRIVIGLGELIAFVGALGAIARLALWGIQWGKKRARSNERARSKERAG